MGQARTFSIAEWYGRDLTGIPVSERKRLAQLKAPKLVDCPFSRGACNKKGGVCSIRPFVQTSDSVWNPDGAPSATCPRRFEEESIVAGWIGEIILGESSPRIVTELPFLSGTAHDGSPTGASVGKIDMVLAGRDSDPLNWCAVEIQSVYFSGQNMGVEFAHLKDSDDEGTPAPQGKRHPDFRSSGPKRLMPQLQIKVPTISRWGRKMAVVIDRAFWESLSPMDEVNDVSNCDIAWFVADYESIGGRFRLRRGSLHLTTLVRAVEGLTAGGPVPLSEFESSLKKKLCG